MISPLSKTDNTYLMTTEMSSITSSKDYTLYFGECLTKPAGKKCAEIQCTGGNYQGCIDTSHQLCHILSLIILLTTDTAK